jgi:hypothetical protein
MQTEGSPPCSQKPAIGPYAQPGGLNLDFKIIFILSFHIRLELPSCLLFCRILWRNFKQCGYRRILHWRLDLLDALIQRVSSLYSSLLYIYIYIYIYTHTHTHTHTWLQSHLHCRYLVAASNGGPSPFSGFPNCPRASATSFWEQQLTTTEPISSITD